jgi:hypothetical protein
MKKVLALVVIAASVTLFSCNENKKASEDAAKMKADSARIADSTAKARAMDSMNKAKAADTSHKNAVDTLNKDVKNIKQDATKMEKDAKKVEKKK